MGEREPNSRERIQKADAHKERPLIQKELSNRRYRLRLSVGRICHGLQIRFLLSLSPASRRAVCHAS